MFFKRLVDLKYDKVKIDIIPQTNEEYVSLTFGCIRLFDSYLLLSDSLNILVQNLDSDDFVILNKIFSTNGNI